MRIAVAPDGVARAGVAQADLAGRLQEVRGIVELAAEQAAEGAGVPAAAGAAQGFGAMWGATLNDLATIADELGANAWAAASAYTDTDAGSMPSGGG